MKEKGRGGLSSFSGLLLERRVLVSMAYFLWKNSSGFWDFLQGRKRRKVRRLKKVRETLLLRLLLRLSSLLSMRTGNKILVRQFRDRDLDSYSSSQMSLVLLWPEARNTRRGLWFLIIFLLSQPLEALPGI